MRILIGLLLLVPTLSMAQSSDRRFGRFLVSHHLDEITDEDRSSALTLPISGNDGIRSLSWRCLEDGLNVTVGTKYLGGDSDDEVSVVVRFAPDRAWDAAYWGAMTGKQAWWMPMRLVPEFTETARARSEVVVRITDPLDGETMTATFSLAGLRQSLERLPCYTRRRP